MLKKVFAVTGDLCGGSRQWDLELMGKSFVFESLRFHGEMIALAFDFFSSSSAFVNARFSGVKLSVKRGGDSAKKIQLGVRDGTIRDRWSCAPAFAINSQPSKGQGLVIAGFLCFRKSWKSLPLIQRKSAKYSKDPSKGSRDCLENRTSIQRNALEYQKATHDLRIIFQLMVVDRSKIYIALKKDFRTTYVLKKNISMYQDVAFRLHVTSMQSQPSQMIFSRLIPNFYCLFYDPTFF